jgi:glycosyltransferase involved in cell wall biosynthesis
MRLPKGVGGREGDPILVDAATINCRPAICTDLVSEETTYPSVNLYLSRSSKRQTQRFLDRLPTSTKVNVVVRQEGKVEYPALFVDDRIKVPNGWVERLVDATRTAPSRPVVPIMNCGPTEVALCGQKATSGRKVERHSFETADEVLSSVLPSYPDVTAKDPLLYLAMSHGLESSRLLDHKSTFCTLCDNLYCWAPPSATKIKPTDSWIVEAEHYVDLLNSRGSDRLPVHFGAVDVGPYGGAYVVLRLVEELNALGFNAQHGHIHPKEHTYEQPYAMIQFNGDRDWSNFESRTGHSDGIFVATHWSTGNLAYRVKEACPNMVLAAFWQDLENRFEREDGQRLPKSQYAEYLTIKDIVYNAPWVWQEGAVEHHLTDARAAHINIGIDTDLFRPESSRHNDKVRVLAMWRPQTKRRGHDLLAHTYQRLHERYGNRVSLETYGWTERAPACAKNHGYQTQEQLAELLQQVDVFVEPSDFQGWGMPGAEALAAGCSLVSTECKGPRAYVNDRGALFVPHSELFEGVCKSVEDRDLRLSLAATGQRQVQECDWSLIARQWAGWLIALWERNKTSDRYEESLARIKQRLRPTL